MGRARRSRGEVRAGLASLLIHLVEASGAKLSAASVSDGTLRFLAIVAALLSEDTGKIYVFEELDNGIHLVLSGWLEDAAAFSELVQPPRPARPPVSFQEDVGALHDGLRARLHP